MPYVYIEGPFKGQEVPEGSHIWSGGGNPYENHYGNGYTFADFAEGPNGELDENGLGWEVEDQLPFAANEGDVYQTHCYGGSGCYQMVYVYTNGDWQLESDTIPWQMKV